MDWKKYEVENQIEISAFYSLFETHLPAGWNFEGEAHDFWECVYVIKGDIYASGDGRVYNLKSGEMIFHEPMEFHKLWIDNENGSDVLIFSFSASGALLDSFRDKVFQLSDSEREIILDTLKYMRLRHKGVNKKSLPMELTYLVPLGKNAEYLSHISAFFTLLFFSLAESKNTAKAEKTPDAKIFYSAVEFMEQNISRQISVSDVANAAKTSVSTIKRIFLRYTDIPVHKYFTSMKLKAATELLQNGSGVTDTADILGFCSQAHFSKVYKSITGKNPSEVRR